MPRVLRSHLERLPLPKTTTTQQQTIARTTIDNEMTHLDALMINAYRLDKNEQKLIQT